MDEPDEIEGHSHRFGNGKVMIFEDGKVIYVTEDPEHFERVKIED